MASKVNVWAELTATGTAAAGSTQYWYTTGGAAQYGRYVTYVAQPLQKAPGTNRYEVHDISHEVDSAGNRQINLQVTSQGSDPSGTYELFLVFTDIIP